VLAHRPAVEPFPVLAPPLSAATEVKEEGQKNVRLLFSVTKNVFHISLIWILIVLFSLFHLAVKKFL
jgi:hypothetical protein